MLITKQECVTYAWFAHRTAPCVQPVSRQMSWICRHSTTSIPQSNRTEPFCTQTVSTKTQIVQFVALTIIFYPKENFLITVTNYSGYVSYKQAITLTTANKMLSCLKETMRLLRGSVLAQYSKAKRIFCTEPYRSVFNHCEVIGQAPNPSNSVN